MTDTREKNQNALILLIDDDLSALEVTRKLLHSLEFRVVETSHAEQGIFRAKTGERPDLVLTDFHMPVKNGVEVIMDIRAWAGEDIPGIVMSGDRSRAMTDIVAGAALPLLSKPFQRSELFELIVNTLSD